MFAKARGQRGHDRSSSAATAPSSHVPPHASPLSANFDNAPLPPPIFQPTRQVGGESLQRPGTSDGLGTRPSNRTNGLRLTSAPVLPPIPRVASRYEPATSDRNRAREDGDSGNARGLGRALDQSKQGHGIEHLVELPPTGKIANAPLADMDWQSPSSPGSASPKMEGTLFPPKSTGPSPLPPTPSGPAMSREFIDSRDKPYSQPQRPQTIQQSYSTPQVPTTNNPLHLSSPQVLAGRSSQSPLSPPQMTPTSANSLQAPHISGARHSPHSSAEDFGALRRAQTNSSQISSNTQTPSAQASSNYSGSTQLPSAQSSVNKVSSPASSSPLSQTLGTPYQSTSSFFPLPRHVSRRPKTAGASAKFGGVSVPTHHSSTAKPESTDVQPKAEKRKTRLLNPIALLSRRKSGQDGVETVADRSAAAQAYERQKSVAQSGLSKMPEDFDPRIKGKVVHDFSTPRSKRGVSYSEADQRPPRGQLQSANSTPAVPQLLPDFDFGQAASNHVKQASESSSSLNRRSAHSPSMFKEILNDDPAQAADRPRSLNAERLENREFLQRVGHQSTVSAYSQESAVLPPFARRSQHLDPMQAALCQDGESKRSSDPSSGKDRDSSLSSFSQVSPTTGRTSVPFATDVRNSTGRSLSPVSPASPMSKDLRHMSAVSDVPPQSARASMLPQASADFRRRDEEETTSRPFSSASGFPVGPTFSPIAEQAPPSSPGSDQSPKRPVQQSSDRDPTMAPEVVTTPAPEPMIEPSAAPSREGLSIPIPDRNSSSGTSPELTPEIKQAETMNVSASKRMPKLVEKRPSAVGHSSKRLSALPKHHPSNASRFSFQMGESAREEQVLEEKHRRMKSQNRQLSPDEDEDEFDESAMDDMDELEMQEQFDEDYEEHDAPLATPMGELTGLQRTRQQLQAPSLSDDGSLYDDDYVDDDGQFDVSDETNALDTARTATQDNHVMARNEQQSSDNSESFHKHAIDQNVLPTSDRPFHSGAGLRIDTSGNNFGQGVFPGKFGQMHNGAHGAESRSGFYMQPEAAGYSPAGAIKPAQREDTPLRQQPNEEHDSSRVASGVSFGSAGGPAFEKHEQRSREVNRPANATPNKSAGLGLTGFEDFDFGSGPDLSIYDSRPTSRQDAPNTDRWTRDSDGMPKRLSRWEDLPTSASSPRASQFPPVSHGQSEAYEGPLGKSIRQRNTEANQNLQYAQSSDGDDDDDEGDDDMYFDDGGFEQDISSPRGQHEHMNEDLFDNDAFLNRSSRIQGYPGQPVHQQRPQSGFSLASLGGDGPYPSFAMGANPNKARQRQSQLLLEDLPLQGPVDPRLIPQRNPSEDAKRLGLSRKVPPLPALEGTQEAVSRMQSNLQAYHTALAEAVNRAAVEGRFSRQSSVSSSRTSESAYSNPGEDDKSHYSQDADKHVAVDGGPGHSASTNTTGSHMEQIPRHEPLRLSFDFGFHSQEDDDGFDDDDIDDDIVAAANGDILGSDDAAFYGQEFDFYAKARPNSADAQSNHGGFFGEDGGGDGLTRSKSIKEPNLTPITERSEFSTRNSYMSMSHASAFGLPSAGLNGPASPALARLPTSPLGEREALSFDQLRKLRASAFAGGESMGSASGSHGSWQSEYGPMKGPGCFQWHHGAQTPHSAGSSSSQAAPTGYFASVPMMGPGALGSSSGRGSNTSQQADSSRPGSGAGYSPSARNSGHAATTEYAEMDATPRKPLPAASAAPEPTTAKKVLPKANTAGGSASQQHSRQGSDHVTYVKEQNSNGSPRWILERRRTSELGQLELVGREVVQGGWI
ncbi:hypothetical protein KC334_g6275 [Hortaea werneckii]|uniref:Uncharacterized protein n=2 Tax=Hortaea werneckii TaxID=91943 RepID=A0A3M7BMW0_HORWE|nr:hypothetical protein KC334_g6275 [Hortaea werneckii]RMY41152.1 hypothetical protein D0866_00781 [Hortaea werneckii]